MKSIWVEGDVRLHKPLRSRMKILWTLQAATLGLLILWLAGMATNFRMGGWIHAFLAGAGIMAILCIAYTFKYGEFLEPFFFRWRKGSKLRHSRPQPPAPEERPGKLP